MRSRRYSILDVRVKLAEVIRQVISNAHLTAYFLYLLLCISCFWSGKCLETGEVTITLCGMKNSNQKQLYITLDFCKKDGVDCQMIFNYAWENKTVLTDKLSIKLKKI